MSTNLPPRKDPFKLVDASGGAWTTLGELLADQFAVVTGVDEDTGAPVVDKRATAGFDPCSLRMHHVSGQRVAGVPDRRFSVQVWNDYDAGDAPGGAEEAPYGQAEHYAARNRSTRFADAQGWTALPGSLERIIDAEDGRYARALVCAGPPLFAPDVVLPGDPDPAEGERTWPEIGIYEPVSGADAQGVTVTQPRVTVGGVTYLGQAAVDAARDALAAGGTPEDARKAVSAVGSGRSAGQGETAERPRASSEAPAGAGPTAPRTPAGSYSPGRPAGYVWSRDAKRVGLLGTLVDPGGAQGSYATGVHGTEIGVLPLRYDAHVSAGPSMTGRMPFTGAFVSDAKAGRSKFIGEFQFDPSRANVGTEVGLETGQWVMVTGVDGRFGPSRVIERREIIIERERDRDKPKPPEPPKPKPRPPTGGPPKPPTGNPPPQPVSDGPGREDPDGQKPQAYGGGATPVPPGGGGGGPPTGGGGPPTGGGSGGSSGGSGGDGPSPSGAQCGAGEGDKGPRGGPPSGGTGSGGSNPAGGGSGLPEVSAPASQERDYEGRPGVPCPNSAAGVENRECGKTTGELVGGMVEDENGRMIDTHGHPAVTTAFYGADQVRYVYGGTQPLTGAEGQL